MTETLDSTRTAPPASVSAEAQVATRAGDEIAAAVSEATAVGVADEVTVRARRLPSGWYVLGLAVQVFLWFLVFLGIAIAIGVGGHLTEFRYVGF